jgi:hypothetical protein
MTAGFVAMPAEYRGDLRLRVLPGRLRAVASFAAMMTIFVLAIVIDLVWKRTRGTATSLPAGVAAAAKGT